MVQSGNPLVKTLLWYWRRLNVDADKEVIPITEDCGVWHPQEGIFNGHFKPTEADKINRIGQLRLGVIKVIEDPRIFTRFVKEIYSSRHVNRVWSCRGSKTLLRQYMVVDIEGKRAIVQGFGNVGSAAAYYLTNLGAKVVGIIDREGGVICEEGFSIEEMTRCF